MYLETALGPLGHFPWGDLLGVAAESRLMGVCVGRVTSTGDRAAGSACVHRGVATKEAKNHGPQSQRDSSLPWQKIFAFGKSLPSLLCRWQPPRHWSGTLKRREEAIVQPATFLIQVTVDWVNGPGEEVGDGGPRLGLHTIHSLQSTTQKRESVNTPIPHPRGTAGEESAMVNPET
jgi:hypothetical protein